MLALLKSLGLFCCCMVAFVLLILFMDQVEQHSKPPRPTYLMPEIVEDAYRAGEVLDRDLYGPEPRLWITDRFWWQPERWQHQLMLEAWIFARQQGGDPKVLTILNTDDQQVGVFDGANVQWTEYEASIME